MFAGGFGSGESRGFRGHDCRVVGVVDCGPFGGEFDRAAHGAGDDVKD